MANQITHLILSERAYQAYFSHIDKTNFYLGSIFPDIRYLGVIERDKTHAYNLKITDITDPAQSAFKAGMLYHSLIDEIRERYVKENGIYETTPESKYISQAIKCLEDELFYNNLSDWLSIQQMFDHVPQEELYSLHMIDPQK